MSDVFTFQLVEALQLPGCPLCRVADSDEQWWMQSFWREGRNSRDGRQRFYDGGGFCRRHAWLLHRTCAEHESGAAIAAVYGALADRDLALLRQVELSLEHGRRTRRSRLARGAQCSACRAGAEAEERRAYFLVQMLNDPMAMERYRRSDGVCFAHLTTLVEVALAEDHEVARLVVRDWKERLRLVREQLAEYDRKRDYRFAAEPKGREQDSWTDVLVRYVGHGLSAERPAPIE